MCTLRVSLLAAIAAAGIAFGFAAGDGTENNPYQISTPDHLEAVNNDLSAHYVLTGDIDLSGRTYERAVIAPDTDYTDSNFNGTSFSGSFDGAGYKILSLIVDASDVTGNYPRYLGLFGKIDEGEVRNLGIENAQITGGDNSRFLGGLCGYNDAETIQNCYVTGSVSGGADSDCLGGLCGSNGSSSTISSCYSTGSVSGGDNSYCLGGLCGSNGSSSTISSCYSTGSVSGGADSYSLGGLCGRNYGIITNCYATSDVSGGSKIGGLCGSKGSSSTISSCYSTGIVSGNENLGGFCGDAGGIVTNCFWDKESSGINTSAGGTGLTTDEMKSETSYSAVGWGISGLWTIDDGNDYPRLAWENAQGEQISLYPQIDLPGTGSEEDPYKISTAEQFEKINQAVAAAYELECDIDFTGKTYSNSVVVQNNSGSTSSFYGNTFSGFLCGNGYTIRNLTINAGCSYVGLFGSISDNGSVKNIGLMSVQINNTSPKSGALCGRNQGIITNCYSRGVVAGNSESGGFCGQNLGTIINCGAECNISGSSSSGFCGYNKGTIISCFSAGIAEKGFCDRNDGSILNCFWDTEASGTTLSSGGAGLPTSLMKDIYTFLNAGWDFAGHTRNGSNDNWLMPEDDYPRLTALHRLTVTFNSGENGSISSGDAEQTVPYAGDAEAPEITPSEGYEFTGWSGSFDNVTEDITITAQYELKSYNVTFAAGENGTITSGDTQQTVSHGGSAAAPAVEADEGYSFAGWSEAFDNITSDLTVTAQYEINTFLVEFNSGAHGEISAGDAEQVVDYGSGAEAPEISPYQGWLFAGWDGDFSEVMSDLVIGAIYEPASYSVVFNAGSHGVISEGSAEQEVPNGSGADAPAVEADAGWEFVGWDKAFESVTSDLTINAQYQVQTFTVVFSAAGKGEIASGQPQQTVEYGNPAQAPQVSPGEGWEFTGWDGDFSSVVSDLAIEAQYSLLGEGTPEEPYEIYNAANLEWAKHWPAASFILMKDLDLSGQSFSEPIFSPDEDPADWRFNGEKFTGSFNGAGHTITALSIHSENAYAGMFGCIGEAGEVLRLGLVEADVAGSAQSGAVCGRNEGTIQSCYVSGLIDCYDEAGGIAGANAGQIVSCKSVADISGYRFAGGLCGSNVGGIERCLSAGKVDAEKFAGGLCSYNDGSIAASFWDILTSGQDSSDGGTGLETPQLREKQTFTGAGWDFSEGGSWKMATLNGETGRYPMLRWQETPKVGLHEFVWLARHWGSAGFAPDSEPNLVDFSKDGHVDIYDLLLLGESWGHTAPARDIFAPDEDFSDGGIPSGWQASGDAGWQITQHAEDYAIRSEPIGDSQCAGITLTRDTRFFGRISFDYLVSSEEGFDGLIFVVDGEPQEKFSGESGWQTFSLEFAPGMHTFTWKYCKDSYWQAGDDTAMIDNIQFSGE
ncbi:InlB B-repeat-containing protein [Sedimentisphaera salicampi]|uniref:Internalin-A n=1 Tax=Sedimentisphaera salicampi TaxID=1941349 RepID=A0A1W6LIW6_9BACT|nr:InlB B-repeat-containing protein [Sedimentisphaera salicampi]ARN55738.1 Internalin-A precursor [Sedimentisphaera salicampi]